MNNYTTNSMKKAITALFIGLILGIAAFMIETGILNARADEETITCWIMCKPGDYIFIREKPSKKAQNCGYLECGDSFETDGSSKGGWIRVLDRGESAEAWVYAGYVVTEKPVEVFENYVCVARKRVACRRWVDGPQISGRLGWLYNGSEVTVFYSAEDWALTSRGYIKAEFLECDPQ